MELKNIFKGLRIRRFLFGNQGRKASNTTKLDDKYSWMNHVSHGYHVLEVERLTNRWDIDMKNDNFDRVVAQREQIENSEFWFFGVFDDGTTSKGVTHYIQSQFFDKKAYEEYQKQKSSKRAMKAALMYARAKESSGVAVAMVIDGEKLVFANMGDYQTVICRDDGEAYQICRKTQNHWSLKLIPSLLRTSEVHKFGCTKISSGSYVAVESEKIDSETEFVILASAGVWQVMKPQEAVNLIRHIEDPQRAAECLAKEALIRMTISNISCLIIRFD